MAAKKKKASKARSASRTKAARKAPAKKAARKAPAKKAARKAPAKKKAARKAPAKKAARKAPAKKAARKAPAKKVAAPKAAAPKAAAPKAAAPKPAAPKPAAPKAAAPKAAAGGSRFIWHELMTPDLAAAKAFYLPLLGWEPNVMQMQDGGSYTGLRASGVDFGGMWPLEPGMGPSSWVPYISVANVDATCATVQAAGGKILMPPKDIPGVGRFAVCADPAGAAFSPMSMANAMPETEGPPKLGQVAWNELVVPDAGPVLPFYEKVFGWTVSKMDMALMGAAGTYHMFNRGTVQVAGVMPMPQGTPMWLTYFGVADVDGTVRDAAARGATVMMPPFSVPGVGRMAVLLDPARAAFAVFKGESA